MRILDGRSKIAAESTTSSEPAIGSLEPHSQPQHQIGGANTAKQPSRLPPTAGQNNCGYIWEQRRFSITTATGQPFQVREEFHISSKKEQRRTEQPPAISNCNGFKDQLKTIRLDAHTKGTADEADHRFPTRQSRPQIKPTSHRPGPSDAKLTQPSAVELRSNWSPNAVNLNFSMAYLNRSIHPWQARSRLEALEAEPINIRTSIGARCCTRQSNGGTSRGPGAFCADALFSRSVAFVGWVQDGMANLAGFVDVVTGVGICVCSPLAVFGSNPSECPG
ncbi:hypothetical protein Nepgr_006553 [Nepenthes gracilis]|uniref:Uncharacterized protein n=1 Tax=Nepenthes gracilis TaxID=150966 RepID=A0AAD3S592_NEPGR|nr:hypothetical protein Nepgr_006553 [Nepenthes gracilis]